uniref:Uncharacterized protein n=1 Tax=Rhizophora mucronata TaxID=61149 RepID=A0A2P2PUM6_RHIMU
MHVHESIIGRRCAKKNFF